MKTNTISDTSPSRRQFVKSFALGTASTVVGPPWIATLLATLCGEQRAAAALNGQLVIQLGDFPALLQAYGSVRVSVNPIVGSSPDGDFYPFVITRGAGNAFYAVSSNCTHRGCITDAYNGTVISCPCHGSEFAMDGTVTSGPAQTNLQRYTLSFDGANTLRITVPGLGYSISSYTLVPGATPRVRLVFPTFTQADYEVRFRQRGTDAWTVVPFATTSTGTANTTVYTGNGAPATIYVDRTAATGFYAIAIIVREV
jgi:Rieske Fe-S protein